MLHKLIRQRREELGMTQQELAEKVGYKDKSSINRIETGERDISRSLVEKFAKALQTTPGYLMGWEDDSNTKTYHIRGDEQRFLMDKLAKATDEDIRKMQQLWKLISEEEENNW